MWWVWEPSAQSLVCLIFTVVLKRGCTVYLVPAVICFPMGHRGVALVYTEEMLNNTKGPM